MAVSDQVVSICVQKHLNEQLAYEEIRRFLSNKFVLDPVLFVQEFGKRPEDLSGSELRTQYPGTLEQGLVVSKSSPLGFQQKFHSGLFFPALS
jgi:hypothetical protein